MHQWNFFTVYLPCGNINVRELRRPTRRKGKSRKEKLFTESKKKKKKKKERKEKKKKKKEIWRYNNSLLCETASGVNVIFTLLTFLNDIV